MVHRKDKRQLVTSPPVYSPPVQITRIFVIGTAVINTHVSYGIDKGHMKRLMVLRRDKGPLVNSPSVQIRITRIIWYRQGTHEETDGPQEG